MTTALTLVLALLLDRLLGEPRRAHPLIAFGNAANYVEKRLYGPAGLSVAHRRVRGVLALLLATGPIVLIATWVTTALIADSWALVVNGVGLYLCIGRQSLVEHARAVSAPLLAGDLDTARIRTGYLVSRQTEAMHSSDISKATIESVLENGNDALFATLFWFLIAGLPGAILHRLANTLDAMWGYRNDRYHAFGWAAAHVDDGLAWLPARLCAASYALCGSTATAWRCWRQQGHRYPSPNGGPVMASGAGALQILLGGDAVYQGQLKQRTALGEGPVATAADIDRSIALLNRATLLWGTVALIMATFFAMTPLLSG